METTATKTGLASLDHTGFMTQNQPRAEAFYRKYFDAEVLERGALTTSARRNGYPPLLFINMGGHRYELFLADRELPPNECLSCLPIIAFEVSETELERALRVFQADGATCGLADPVANTLLQEFVDRSVYVLDADQNVVELCHRVKDGGTVPVGGSEGPLRIGRISHVVAESTDLARDTAFYVDGMRMRLVSESAEEVIFQTSNGQLLVMRLTDRLSERSLYRSGRDGWPVPESDYERVNKGAHVAYSVESNDIFHELKSRIVPFGGYDEGDHRAADRGDGSPSTYFYDPSGNRLQLIVI